jgi:pectate lyase
MVYSPPLPQPPPWTYSGAGQWSWQYEGVNSDLHFKQTSTAGDARAAVGPEQIINTDQIVEARVRPRAFNAAGDPWFGVMARYADANNYVYVSLRRSNTVTLRKLQNGSIVQLGSAVLPVTLDAWYTLRLETVGSSVRAYVNGRLLLEATDPQPAIGRVGLLGYRTAADYDDIRAVVP